MVDVIRKTCNAGEQTKFEFSATSVAYRVKNFTTAPLLVCLGEWDDSQTVMVGTKMAETIISHSNSSKVRRATATVIIKTSAVGIVEVIRDDASIKRHSESCIAVTVDPSLSVGGQAADAQVTGSAIQSLSADVRTVNDRINNLSTLSEGSTTGDAELIDIRVGANGTTYDSAGEAVRGQIGALKSDLVELSDEVSDIENVTTNSYYVTETTQIIDFLAEHSGKYFNSAGALAEYDKYTAVVYKVAEDCNLHITSANGANNSIVRILVYTDVPPSEVGVAPTSTPTIIANNVTSYDLNVTKDTYVAIDYGTANGLVVNSVASIKMMVRKSDDDIRIKYTSTGFLILYPSKSGDYVGYQYGRYTVSSVNVDVWRIKTIYVYDKDLNQKYLLCSNSYDCEGVLKINDETDYIGSVHGDEVFTDVKLIIDGKIYSVTDNIDMWCKNVSFFVKSNVYQQDSNVLAFTKDKCAMFDKNGVTVTNKWKAVNTYTLTHVRSCLVSINKYADTVKLIDSIYDTHKQLFPISVPDVTSTASILYSDNAIDDAYVVGDIASLELHALERGGNSNQGMVNDMGSRIKPYIDCYVGATVQTGEEIYCKSRFKYSCN